MDSVHLVSSALSQRPLTMRHLVDETGLARRTVYTVLGKLRAMGLLKEQTSLKDARQTYFWLNGQSS